MICAGCRAPIPDHVKFCPTCGTKAETVIAQVPHTKRCPMCGAYNLLSAKFCKADGHPLQQVEQAPSAAPPLEVKAPTVALSCPKCGTSYPVTVKFCRNDGIPLKSVPTPSPEATQPSVSVGTEQTPGSKTDPPVREEANQTVLVEVAAQPEPEETDAKQEAQVAAQPDVEVGTGAVGRPSRSWLWPAVAGVVLLLVGGAGYLYYSGFLGKDPAKVQMKLDAELKAQGLDDIYVEVSKDWVATVGGFVENEADRGRVLGIVESNNDVKEVEDRITVATAKDGPPIAATDSPSAQPPSMGKVEEMIKQGSFE